MDVEQAYGLALAILRDKAPDLATAVGSLGHSFDGTQTVAITPAGMRINRRFFEGLGDEGRASVLATAGFRLTSPLIRPCGGRDPFLWNIACSVVTNANLDAMGFRLPTGAMLQPGCKDLTSDQVYERIRGMEGKVAPRKLDA